MKKDNMFLEDVRLPEIVQRKADIAFLAIQTERSARMNKITENGQNMETETTNHIGNIPHSLTEHAQEIGTGRASRTRKTPHGLAGKRTARRLIAAAACAAVLLVSGSMAGPLKSVLWRSDSGQKEPAPNGTEDNTALQAVEQIDRMFTLQVMAAGAGEGEAVPLKEGHPIPLITNSSKADSWVLCDDDNGNTVNYCINIPQITCEGDDIQSITYSINRGAFQIVQPTAGESIILDGQAYDGELNTGSIGGHYEDDENAKEAGNPGSTDSDIRPEDGPQEDPYEFLLYHSFTVDYQKQSDENTWINFCNVLPDSSDISQLIWKEGATEEDQLQAMQKMLDQTTITCTVNYTDQTSQSVDIKVGSRLMTRREAGEPLDPGMSPEELEEQTVVITFEQQPAEAK